MEHRALDHGPTVGSFDSVAAAVGDVDPGHSPLASVQKSYKSYGGGTIIRRGNIKTRDRMTWRKSTGYHQTKHDEAEG